MSNLPIDNARFCPSCGSSDFSLSRPNARSCAACNFVLYFNCGVGVAAIIACDRHVLLTVRDREPGKGGYGFPGGFVDDGEALDEGLRREVREEIGIDVGDLEYLCSFPHIYHYRGVDYPTCDAIFLVRLSERPAAQPLDEVRNLIWFPVDAVPIDEIAFESLRRAMRVAVAKI